MKHFWQRDGITIYCGKSEDVAPLLIRRFGTIVLDAPMRIHPLDWLSGYATEGGKVLVLGREGYEIIPSADGFMDMPELAPEFRFGHPAVRPLTSINALLRLTAGAVFDPFMGTGTTLLAAKQLGREAVGIERNAKDCQTAVERLEA